MTKMDVMSINIHRMFEYLFCADESSSFLNLRFENDVKMYGTQTPQEVLYSPAPFENDVKMYGTQTMKADVHRPFEFENDVKMYGTQTPFSCASYNLMFENDVKMYGTQTYLCILLTSFCLRMM